jgi:exodeoxyribonuclease VII small subunit
VKQLEGGELPLEQSLQLFERGMDHAKRCEELLNQVEGKIRQLIETRTGELAECEWHVADGE